MNLCTDAHPLPYPKVSPRLLKAVFAAVSEAWRRLTVSGYKPSPNAPVFDEFDSENAITDQLVLILRRLADEGSISGFNYQTFETIPIGGREPNEDATSFGNQPDFVIRPIRAPIGVPKHDYGIYIECKVIDDTRSVNLYIVEGVERFVDKRYAWSMPHGVMIGYICNGESLPSSLSAAFKALHVGNHVLRPVDDKVTKAVSKDVTIYETRHLRPKSSDEIRLDHLWLHYDRTLKASSKREAQAPARRRKASS
ncbi:hypothetical protein [Burkholderia cenocepacia]|uniref:hypothetical protein n=1 Tax=Burkholderia cenocepacia TaxID=95486 RepID=UPI000ACE9B70|nr:hypothetical protein [Burkholderia cenocepacia]